MLSEQTFRTIFNNAIDGVLVAEVKCEKIRMANEVFCRMTGYSEGELKELTFKDLHREEDFPFVMKQLESLLSGKLLIVRNMPFKRKNNSVFYADVNTVQICYGDTHYLFGIFRDVTDRKEIENELFFKTTLLETQLETSIDGILVVDSQRNAALFNQRFTQMWKIPHELLDSKDSKKMLEHAASLQKYPEEFVKRVELLYKHKQEKTRDEIELKDGRVFDRYSSPMTDTDGNYLGRIWYFRDISDHKRAENALKNSRETFNLVMQVTNDALWDLDVTTNQVYRNPRHATMLGYKPEELSSSQEEWETRIHPDDKERVLKEFKKHFDKSEGSFEIEYRLRKKSGDYVWILGRGKAVEFDAKGNALRILGTNIDITDRKKAEEALRESEDKYRALVESAGETIAVIDKDGVFQFMNTIAARRLGGKPGDYVGKTMWDMFPKDVADRQVSDIQKVIETRKRETLINPTDILGELCWYETTIEPLRNSKKEVTSALIIARDITEIKKTQEELNAYREEMTHAERLASLGTLSATAAHELTQPLTVIRLLIENALTKLEKTSSPETVTEKLRESLTEISNITSVVNRFRNFARKSSDRVIREINLKTIAVRIVNLLNESSVQRGVELLIEDMDGLPHIYSNERDLEQLFFALIDNAIYASADKVNQRIKVSGTASDENVEIKFTDNCGGIAPENIEKIFEPFFTTKPAGQGTGLGLCIVRDIVSRAEGKIRVESEFGEGSVFSVTLPINKDMK